MTPTTEASREAPLTDYFPISLAAHRPKKMTGKSISSKSIWRWWRDGVRGEKLDAVMFGGRIFVNEAALLDFGRRVAATPKLNRRAKIQRHAGPCFAPLSSTTKATARRRIEPALLL